MSKHKISKRNSIKMQSYHEMCEIHEELANKFQGIKLFKEQELKGVS